MRATCCNSRCVQCRLPSLSARTPLPAAIIPRLNLNSTHLTPPTPTTACSGCPLPPTAPPPQTMRREYACWIGCANLHRSCSSSAAATSTSFSSSCPRSPLACVLSQSPWMDPASCRCGVGRRHAALLRLVPETLRRQSHGIKLELCCALA